MYKVTNEHYPAETSLVHHLDVLPLVIGTVTKNIYDGFFICTCEREVRAILNDK